MSLGRLTTHSGKRFPDLGSNVDTMVHSLDANFAHADCSVTEVGSETMAGFFYQRGRVKQDISSIGSGICTDLHLPSTSKWLHRSLGQVAFAVQFIALYHVAVLAEYEACLTCMRCILEKSGSSRLLLCCSFLSPLSSMNSTICSLTSDKSNAPKALFRCFLLFFLSCLT